MAIVHADNFSMYGTSTSYMLNGVYAAVSGFHPAIVNDPDGTSPGKVLYIGTGTLASPDVVRFVYPATTTTMGTALRVWLSNLPGNTAHVPYVFDYRNDSNVRLIAGYITTTGVIVVVDGSGTELGRTANPVLTANAWWHIETKAFFDASAGTLEIRVEGVTVLTLGSLTIAGPAAQMQWRNEENSNTGGGAPMYVKDAVMWDGSGGWAEDFLGSVSVYSMPPVSDVSVGWTLNGGATGFGILDNNPPVDATEYLSAPYPAPPASTFGLGILPDNVTSIKCLMTMVRAKKIDGGDGNLQNSLVSATNTADGADRPITAAFTYWRDFFNQDPDTSAPWTVAAAEAALLKINRTL